MDREAWQHIILRPRAESPISSTISPAPKRKEEPLATKPRRPAARSARKAAPRRPPRPARAKAAARKPPARPPARPAATRTAAAARAADDRRRKDPQSLRLRALEPSLTADDLERSVRFYTTALGFFVSERWEDKGVLKGVMLKAGVCTIGLSQDDWSKGRGRKKGEGMRIWCQTAQDIDALAARIKAAGGKLTEEPRDQPWGARSLSVDDPDGFHLTIYNEG
jgi:lactoylglutathione lyase